MANLSPVALIIILVVCVVIALVIGYFIGSRSGGDHKEATEKEKQKHDDLKSDVREHFQQTSAIMSRMVEDYRQMYEHMSEGAEKLGDLSQEKMVAPPSPEAITQDSDKDANAEKSEADAEADKNDTSGSADKADKSESGARSDNLDKSDKKTAAPASAGSKDRKVDHHTDNAGHADSGNTVQTSNREKAPAPKPSPAPVNNAGKAASDKSRTSASSAQNKDAPKSGSQKAPPAGDGKTKGAEKSASGSEPRK